MVLTAEECIRAFYSTRTRGVQKSS